MVIYANIVPAPSWDGLLYCLDEPMPTVESDLYRVSPPNIPGGAPPVPTLFNQALVAVVTFTAGPGAVSPSYVVLQTSVDEGQTWLDVAWCVWTGTTGSTSFLMAAGQPWALVTQQTRTPNTAPGSSSALLGPLGGQFRFVGRTSGSGGSSSGSSGVPPPMAVTIWYRQVGLR